MMNASSITAKHSLVIARTSQENHALVDLIGLDRSLSFVTKSFVMNGKTFVKEDRRKPERAWQAPRGCEAVYISKLTDTLDYVIAIKPVNTYKKTREVMSFPKHINSRYGMGGDRTASVDAVVSDQEVQHSSSNAFEYDCASIIAKIIVTKHQVALDTVKPLIGRDTKDGEPLITDHNGPLLRYVKDVFDVLKGREERRYKFDMPSSNIESFEKDLELLLSKYDMEIIK